MADHPEVEVEVLADGDVLRGERLARSLFRSLSEAEGLAVRLPADTAAVEPGAKGMEVVADASMWVFLTAGVQAGSRILLATIQAWTQRERHRTVRLKIGDRSIEVPAAATPGQERIVETFLRGDEH
ncbi:hypothetical protein [Micromonospora sp. WMMD980]|uniref:hypothetical protein n=1 Tax=Micromonospora sp. WMMD980 TaxID=3016088 RepID=UPI002415D0D0|nr:hypothetical protein [Micromonospora sp. WMMD980]MDG4803397.1 hypothetical protein [Micromonospora sp. WMMD980]